MKFIRYFREQALEKKNIEFQLVSKSEQLALHLFKIFYHGTNPERIEHWSGDLFDLLYSVPKQKSTKKFPKEDLIYPSLWGYQEDNFTSLTHGLVAKLNKMARQGKEGFGIIEDNSPNPLCFEFCKSYFSWISKELSHKGEVTEDEIRDTVSRILKEIKR